MDSVEGGRNVELDNWLSIATRKLCTESQERIRKEIEEHYFEAVDDAKSQGHGDADARRGAIETLGDPRSAARSFRRHHLTSFQAGLVKEIGRKPPKYRFYLYVPLVVLAFAVNVTHVSSIRDGVIFVGMLSTMLMAFAAHFWWVQWLYHHRHFRASVSVDMLSVWFFFASMQFGSSLLREYTMMKDVTFFVIYGSALLVLLVLLTRLLRKWGHRPHNSA